MQGRQNSKISLLGESLQQWIRYLPFYTRHYTKKMKFSIKDSFSTEELLKKSLLKNFFFLCSEMFRLESLPWSLKFMNL